MSAGRQREGDVFACLSWMVNARMKGLCLPLTPPRSEGVAEASLFMVGPGVQFSRETVVASSSEGYWCRLGSLCEEGWDDFRRPSCVWHVKTPP